MNRTLKQIAFALVGAAIASLSVWLIVNWMPNTLQIVASIAGGYIGFKLVK